MVIGQIDETLRSWFQETDDVLECNGRRLRVAKYPKLFECIGYMYGGEAEYFCIPNIKHPSEEIVTVIIVK